MTISSVSPMTSSGVGKSADAVGTAQADKIRNAAKEVEGVFLREMLKAMGKATKTGSGAPVSGQDAYGSMVVETVANSVAQSGGIGIQDLIVRSLDEALGKK